MISQVHEEEMQFGEQAASSVEENPLPIPVAERRWLDRLLRILGVVMPLVGGLLPWARLDWFFLSMILWVFTGALLLRSWWALLVVPVAFAMGMALGAVLLSFLPDDWPSLPAGIAEHFTLKEPAVSGLRRWFVGIITVLGMLGAPVMGSLLLFAHRFVDFLSRPGVSLDAGVFTFQLPPAGTPPPRSQQRPLVFQAADGTVLRGEFWAQRHPAPTIIFCHGYRLSRDALRPVGTLAYPLGYNVLLFDFRGHGQSERATISGGHVEVRDLQAAITVASQQPETLAGSIIIHGFSMGAAVALLAPPTPEVAAIIADSPYARLDEVLRRFVIEILTQESSRWFPLVHRLQRMVPFISWAIVAASALVFRVRFGYSPIACPDSSFEQWRALPIAQPHCLHPPILLIHGEQDQVIPIAHARSLEARARALKFVLETYYVKDADHCGAYGFNPQRYLQVVQQFLVHHLGEDVLHGQVA